MLAAGTSLGIAAAIPAARWIRTLLFNVPPWDALSLSAAAAFVLLVSLAAALQPAARAAGVEPAAALREENYGNSLRSKAKHSPDPENGTETRVP